MAPLLALFFWMIHTAYSIMTYADDASVEPADAIIVLGAAVWRDRPSPVFQERINHAVTLYHQGLAPTIIFTGGLSPGDLLTEAEVAKRYAQERGVPARNILIETRSTNTEQNLRFARQIAAEQGLRSFILVSDPFHMKRVMLLAQDMGMQGYSSPTPSTRYQSWRSKTPFLLRETYFYTIYLLRSQLPDPVDTTP